MKKISINIFFITFILVLFTKNVFANDVSTVLNFENKNKVVATYTVNNLTITSYSKSWTKPMLQKLYQELLNNFHGDELEYLSDIYIYPDSPEGVNGLYYDNIYLQNGEYVLGKNACIKLFNADRYNSIEKIAYTLSHEYGHHYMIYNIMKKENIYYADLRKCKYVKVRELENEPVIYDNTKNGYIYYWDILEIMADDYVQLLGSSNAKKSYHYKSIDELLKEGKGLYENVPAFNLKPQLNPYLPLAADVKGLYSYMLNLSGFTSSLNPPEKPKLDKIAITKTIDDKPTYTVSLQKPLSEEVFEYTLVIYPKDNPFVPYPLKTFTSKEPLNVVFGSYAIKQKDGSIKSISQNLEGEYTLRLYIKDARNFMYSIEPITYDFTELSQHIKEDEKPVVKTENAKEIKTETKPTNLKPIGPSPNGSLDNLFQIVAKKQII